MKKVLSAGATLALALIVAACGSGSSSSGGAPAVSAGSSKPFSELRLDDGGVRRVDVVNSFDIATTIIVSQFAQGLTSFDTDGRVVPALASSVDQPDATTYVYHLRPGLRFSDGKPLTVGDVVWSLKRAMGSTSQVASFYTSVKSIAPQGADTVVVKLKRPDVTWPAVSAFAGQVVEKAAALRGGVAKLGTPSNLPIGTGPYRFQSFSADTGATLVVNPYWSGPKPAAQRVVFENLRDEAAAQLALRSGDIDVSTAATGRAGFRIPGVTLYEGPGIEQEALSMNTIVAPFDDVHVRRAIAYAVDRAGIAQAAANGGYQLSDTLTPLSLYGNIAPVAQVRAAFATLPRWDFDLQKARAELAQSRYPHGFTASIDAVPGDPIPQALVPDLAKVGITLKLKPEQYSQWLAELYGPRDKVGFMNNPYDATYPDPSSLMSDWLDPAAAVVNGLNSANYRSAEMGRLLEAQRSETARAARLRLITEAFRLVRRDVPYIPLYSLDVYLAMSSRYVLSERFSPWTAYFTPWIVDVHTAS